MSDRTRLMKLKKLLENKGFVIRHEKGQFKSGACIVHERKVIIINKFLSDESKLEALQHIVSELNSNSLLEANSEKGKDH